MKKLAKALLNLPGVVGVSDPRERIVLYVESPKYAEAVPSVLAGHPVEVKVVGKIRVLPFVTAPATVQTFENRLRHRPLVGGISISDPENIAGTLGVITFDGKILTNAHVIAINFEKRKWNEIGTPIIQPAVLDGGDPEKDVVGHLTAHASISDKEHNKIDAAIGEPTVGVKKGVILGIGKIRGWTDPQPGMEVVKSGRTTGVTRGKIFDPHATIKVYGYLNLPEGYAIFEDVIVIEPAMSHAGDSGSALVTPDGYIVGLVFAGSEYVTVACKAKHIIDSLNVDLGEKIPLKGRPTRATPSYPEVVVSSLPILLLCVYYGGESIWAGQK